MIMGGSYLSEQPNSYHESANGGNANHSVSNQRTMKINRLWLIFKTAQRHSNLGNSLHTGGVAGSIPASPTIFLKWFQSLKRRPLHLPPLFDLEHNRKGASQLGEISGSRFAARSAPLHLQRLAARLPTSRMSCLSTSRSEVSAGGQGRWVRRLAAFRGTCRRAW